MNETIKNTVILTVITLISGLLLGTVYEVTKGPIAAEQEKTKQAAFQSVFESADSFEAVEATDFPSDELTTIDEVVTAKSDAGETMGYVITVTDHEGYGGDIQCSVGIGNDGTVNGVEILAISETAGLGMRADTEEFKAQFRDKNVKQFSYTKSGAAADNEIDALSGATITTNAMTNAINAALSYFQNTLQGGSAS